LLECLFSTLQSLVDAFQLFKSPLSRGLQSLLIRISEMYLETIPLQPSEPKLLYILHQSTQLLKCLHILIPHLSDLSDWNQDLLANTAVRIGLYVIDQTNKQQHSKIIGQSGSLLLSGLVSFLTAFAFIATHDKDIQHQINSLSLYLPGMCD
jgi:hypothetical protein